MTVGEPEAILSFTHALLYGIYITTLAYSLRLLVFDTEGRNLRTTIHWPIIIVTLILFILSTANLAAVFRMVLVAIEGRGPSAYNALYTWSAWWSIAALLLVDAVLIFRCWLVYLKTWLIIVFPLALWLADFVSAIIGLVKWTPNSPWPSPVENPTLYRSLLSGAMTFQACQIAINVYVTIAIVIQILRVSRWSSGPTSERLHKISRILAESGILFTVTCILNMIFKALAMSAVRFQPTSTIIGCINMNTATIVFNLILIRMAQEQPREVTDSEESSNPPILTTFPLGVSTYSTTEDECTIPDIEMQAMSQVTKTEGSTL